jgi:hypothetical protein
LGWVATYGQVAAMAGLPRRARLVGRVLQRLDPVTKILAAPELIEAQPVEMLDQSQIALKLQGWLFTDRMMRCQECAEPDTRHQDSSPVRSMQFRATDESQIPKASRPTATSPEPFKRLPPVRIFQANRHRRQWPGPRHMCPPSMAPLITTYRCTDTSS